jgi:SAM-dependent methyltransferase
MNVLETSETWAPYLARYHAGEWRDRIFHDMVLADARRLGPAPTILDIGCGQGLDGEIRLQRSVAEAAGRFIGIEPDLAVTLGDHFTDAHRCRFEEAHLETGSVDLAYAVMVLEHLPQPRAFWNKLFEVLADDGVFWGLTVDGRHLFSRLSLWADRLKIKNLYMNCVLGRVSESGRYQNYPTYYRANSPAQISLQAREFRSCEIVNFSRVNQGISYWPAPLRGVAHAIEKRRIRKRRPGSLLAVRVVK